MQYEHINQRCKEAINEALHHHLFETSPFQAAVEDVEVLNDTLMKIQGWLFFTTESLTNTMSSLVSSETALNFFFNTHVLFMNRLGADKDGMKTVKQAIAAAMDIRATIPENAPSKSVASLSLIPIDYINRMTPPNIMVEILDHNPILITILCLWLYLDNAKLADRLTAAKIEETKGKNK